MAKKTRKKKAPAQSNESLFDNNTPKHIYEAPSSFYLYIDNDEAHHFYAQYSIFTKKAFEHDYRGKSFSTSLDWGIILVDKALSQETISSFGHDETRYPVLLEIDGDAIKGLNSILIDVKYHSEFNTIKDYRSNLSICAIVTDSIFFGYVKNIIFQNEEQLKRFFSFPAANVAFNKSLGKVDSELFIGKHSVVIDNLSIPTKSQKSCIKDIVIKNRLRASLLGAISSSRFSITKYADTHYDKTLLNLYYSSVGQDNNKDFEKAYELLQDSLRQWLLDHRHIPVLSSNTYKDTTCFTDWLWSLNIIDDSDINLNTLCKGLYDITDIDKAIDIVAFRMLACDLLNEHEFKPMHFIDCYADKFIQCLPEIMAELKIDTEDKRSQIKNTYVKLFAVIKERLNGFSTSKYGMGKEKYSTLYALMHLCMAYDSSDPFEALSKRLNAINEDPFCKRYIWSLFGMLYGMTYINKEVKCDEYNLLFIDAVINKNVDIHGSAELFDLVIESQLPIRLYTDDDNELFEMIETYKKINEKDLHNVLQNVNTIQRRCYYYEYRFSIKDSDKPLIDKDQYIVKTTILPEPTGPKWDWQKANNLFLTHPNQLKDLSKQERLDLRIKLAESLYK